MVPFPRLNFRYLAIEGPPGLGKTALAERLAARLNAAVVLDEPSNPFLSEFYAGRSGEGCFAPYDGRFEFYRPNKA